MNDLRTAAQAVLDRWDSPTWEWVKQGPTAALMADLRAALAQEQVSEMLVDDLCLLRLGWTSGADGDLYRAATDRVIARAVKVRGLRKINQLEGKA